MAEGIAEYRVTSGLNVPYMMGLFGRSHAVCGNARRALAVLDDALALAASTKERWYEAEALLRLKGETLLDAGGARLEAEDTLARAREIAAAQGARWLEERAKATAAGIAVRN